MERGTLALYLRTSLEDYGKANRLLDQSCSILNQRRLLEDYIAAHEELRLLRRSEYIDDGFTGTNMERPEFQRMVRDARDGAVCCILIKDLSRLGRNYLEVGEYLERVFPSSGVRLISVNDGYDSGLLLGTTGGLDVAFRNFIYDSYSKDLSVKVRTAMQTRMEKGKFINHTPYGYRKDPADKHHLIPDPATAPVVAEIFRAISEGVSTSEMAKELNRREIPTPLQYKRHRLKPACADRRLLWSHVTVLNILHNYKYTGAMVNHTRESRYLRDPSQRRTAQDEWIVTEGTHEALVSREAYEQANAALRHPRKPDRFRAHDEPELFFCGQCGRKLQKTFGNDVYYSCCTHKYVENAPCKGLRWSKTELDAVLLPIYRIQLSLIGKKLSSAAESKAPTDIAQHQKRLAQIEREISSCAEQKLRLFEEFHDGKLDVEAFLQRKTAQAGRQKQFKAERAELEAELARERDKKNAQEEDLKKLKGFLRPGQEEGEMQKVMYEDIERVYVQDAEHLLVRWKFTDFLAERNLSD